MSTTRRWIIIIALILPATPSRRARSAIPRARCAQLAKLQPQTRARPPRRAVEIDVPIDDVRSGDIVIVRPGRAHPRRRRRHARRQRGGRIACSPANRCRSRRRRATASSAAPSTARARFVSGHDARRGERAGADRDADAGRPGLARADSAARRPHQRRVRAGGRRRSRSSTFAVWCSSPAEPSLAVGAPRRSPC